MTSILLLLALLRPTASVDVDGGYFLRSAVAEVFACMTHRTWIACLRPSRGAPYCLAEWSGTW